MEIGKLVADIDAVATQHGLTERHDLDALAGVAVSAWRISKSHEAAIDAARTEARRLAHDIAAKQAIDQMIAAVRSHGSPLATIQAGL